MSEQELAEMDRLRERIAEMDHILHRLLKWAHPQMAAVGDPPWWDAEFDSIYDAAVVAHVPEPEDEIKRNRRIAELEASGRKCGETYSFQSDALVKAEARIAELEAALAASVPREVAELAIAMTWGGAMASVHHGAPPYILDAIDGHYDRLRRLCPATSRDVVARAEAEHGGSTPARRESFAELCADILAWQAATFPHRTPSSITEHLRREATELAKEPGDAEEMADVGLLLIAAADASGVDLLSAIRAKLEKNKRRTWGTPDAHGVVSHVEPAEAEAKEAKP